MTVGKDLHQTLSNLEGAKSELENFALNTEDQQAQTIYNQCAQQIENVSQQLENRTNYVEDQEPQYKSRGQNKQNQ